MFSSAGSDGLYSDVFAHYRALTSRFSFGYFNPEHHEAPRIDQRAEINLSNSGWRSDDDLTGWIFTGFSWTTLII